MVDWINQNYLDRITGAVRNVGGIRAPIVLLEVGSVEAVAEIAAVISVLRLVSAVDGVDGIFIGPYDLSGSYGIPGQTQDPVVRGACRRVIEACQRGEKSVGLLVVRPTAENVRGFIDDGFTLLCLGLDTVFLDQGARAVKAMALDALRDS